MITLSGLYVYPVKSCRGIALDRATLTPTGLQHDREWLIVTPAGRFITQREAPRLALIATRLTEAGLALQAPGMESIEVPYAVEGQPTVQVTIWRDQCQAFDAGDEAALWLERFLGRPARIVRFDASQPRPVDPAWSSGLAAFSQFADAFPVLVISSASLADLNGRLAKPLPMERFRPNFVLEGCAAYAEDALGTIELGAARLRVVKPCTRCVITTTDQATGERDGDEPLRTLQTYRWNKQLKGVAFGQNAVVAAGAGCVIERGMRVQALM